MTILMTGNTTGLSEEMKFFLSKMNHFTLAYLAPCKYPTPKAIILDDRQVTLKPNSPIGK